MTRVVPFGREALLVEVGSEQGSEQGSEPGGESGGAAEAEVGPGRGAGRVRAAAAALRTARAGGRLPLVLDLVPAAETIVVVLRDGTSAAQLAETRAVIEALLASTALRPATAEGAGATIEIPVHYDGPDLAEVATLTGLSPAEVIAAHCGAPWQVAFTGFAPGFAYLVGGDPRLAVPRRADPRTAVPAGSVALAGRFSGIYPRATPGGWQLIGRTQALLFDPDRDPPSLLRPGTTVRFRPAPQVPARTGAPSGATAARPVAPAAEPVAGRHLVIEATGPLTLIQDEGRPGYADSGVGRSGAADRGALRLGARLVGNAPTDAGLEVTAGGLQARMVGGAATIALTGAVGPAQVDGRPVGHNAPIHLADGARLTLGAPTRGLRTYLSVRGGIAVRPVLASRSSDTFAGIGPDPVRVGDRLPIGTPGRSPITVEVAPVAPPAAADEIVTLDVTDGPNRDWFPDRALDRTLDRVLERGMAWVVSDRSDRRALRLTPPAGMAGWSRTESARGRELVSTGMVRGAVQVPPNGHPVVFLSDHPVTGGYPVIAVLTPDAADRAAQLRPGQSVRWRPVG